MIPARPYFPFPAHVGDDLPPWLSRSERERIDALLSAADHADRRAATVEAKRGGGGFIRAEAGAIRWAIRRVIRYRPEPQP